MSDAQTGSGNGYVEDPHIVGYAELDTPDERPTKLTKNNNAAPLDSQVANNSIERAAPSSSANITQDFLLQALGTLEQRIGARLETKLHELQAVDAAQ